MSVKKMLLLSAASVAAVSMTAAMAGGYSGKPDVAVDNGYYFEGHGGYAAQNYFDDTSWRINTGVDSNDGADSNVHGGFTGGVDAGYKINRHFAVELGWFHLPTVNVNPTGSASAYLRSWVLYLAGKYMVPFGDSQTTDMFFKFGAAYRDAELASGATVSNAISSRKSDYVRPIFALGFDRVITPDFSAIFQYNYFMGARNSFPFTAANSGALGTVAANVFTIGLGYKFTI